MNTVYIPCLVNGVNMDVAEEALEKRTGGHENDNEIADWTEYWMDGALVHRSAHVHLKHGLESMATQGAL